MGEEEEARQLCEAAKIEAEDWRKDEQLSWMARDTIIARKKINHGMGKPRIAMDAMQQEEQAKAFAQIQKARMQEAKRAVELAEEDLNSKASVAEEEAVRKREVNQQAQRMATVEQELIMMKAAEQEASEKKKNMDKIVQELRTEEELAWRLVAAAEEAARRRT